MKRIRVVVVLLVILAITATIGWNRAWALTTLPTKVVKSLTYQTMNIDMPVIGPDGKTRQHFKGRISWGTPEIMQVDNRHYLCRVAVELDKQQQRQIGAPSAALLELRDENHKMVWRRMVKGTVYWYKAGDRNHIAFIMPKNPKNPLSVRIRGLCPSTLVMLDGNGQVRWSTPLPEYAFGQGPIVDMDGAVLIYSSGQTQNKTSGYRVLVKADGRLVAGNNKIPGDMEYIGKYQGKYCFLQAPIIRQKADKHVQHNHYDFLDTNMVEMNGRGEFGKPVTLKGIGYARGYLNNGKLVVYNGKMIGCTPWMRDDVRKLTDTGDLAHFRLEPSESKGTATPLLAHWGGQIEIEREFTVGVSLVDTSNESSWKLKTLASREFYDEGVSLCHPYGSADALVILSGQPNRIVMKGDSESWVLVVNRWGNEIARYKFPGRVNENADITVLPDYCLVHLQFEDTIELPMVSTPTISTTPTAEGLRVSITCATKGASIRYSVNERDPDSKGQRYRGEFTVPKGSTITARATAPRTLPSQIAEVVGK